MAVATHLSPSPASDAQPAAEPFSQTSTVRVGSRSPWGVIDDVTPVAVGIDQVGTPGHGGVQHSTERNRAVDEAWRRPGGWYEEDCEWAIVAMAFPDAFPPAYRRDAVSTARNYFPDEYEAVTGETIRPGESHARDEATFFAEHANDWVTTAALAVQPGSVEHDGDGGCGGAGDHLVGATGAHLSELGRDERIAAMRNEIDRAMRDLSNAEGWQAFLESRSRFHNYSLGNAFLICHQNPAATQVAGFNDWKNKHGRSVKKGERAIWILAPITRKVDVVGDDGATSSASRVVGFRAVPVFDVSQTEGPPLPERPHIDAGELDDVVPEAMVEELTSFVEARGFSISRGDAGGWTTFSDKSVVISDKATDAVIAGVKTVLDHLDGAKAKEAA